MTLAAGLAACSSVAPGPDQAELSAIWRFNVVPKSTPDELVGAFARTCVQGPATDNALRAAGYVPTSDRGRRAATLYVVDDRRPAIAVSERMCVVQAASRTGQTDAMRRYVARSFPSARPLDPEDFEADLEEVWAVTSPRAGIVATERKPQFDGSTYYALIYFSEGGFDEAA